MSFEKIKNAETITTLDEKKHQLLIINTQIGKEFQLGNNELKYTYVGLNSIENIIENLKNGDQYPVKCIFQYKDIASVIIPYSELDIKAKQIEQASHIGFNSHKNYTDYARNLDIGVLQSWYETKRKDLFNEKDIKHRFNLSAILSYMVPVLEERKSDILNPPKWVNPFMDQTYNKKKSTKAIKPTKIQKRKAKEKRKKKDAIKETNKITHHPVFNTEQGVISLNKQTGEYTIKIPTNKSPQNIEKKWITFYCRHNNDGITNEKNSYTILPDSSSNNIAHVYHELRSFFLVIIPNNWKNIDQNNRKEILKLSSIYKSIPKPSPLRANLN